MSLQRVLVLSIAGLLLAGCTTIQLPRGDTGALQGQAVPSSATASVGWWNVAFRFAWPEGVEPAWHLDLLIADQVVRPALEAQRNNISLWRVHRRAARDGAGHQFSFIFRSTPRDAARVYEVMRANPTLQRLQRRGLVERVRYDDLRRIARPGLADASDGSWSIIMQRSWPAFIMGVSQTWLDLIAEVERSRRWPPGLDARWRAIAAEVDRIWQDEGGHALLHHLNAVFGYRPVTVTTHGSLRF